MPAEITLQHAHTSLHNLGETSIHQVDEKLSSTGPLYHTVFDIDCGDV